MSEADERATAAELDLEKIRRESRAPEEAPTAAGAQPQAGSPGPAPAGAPAEGKGVPANAPVRAAKRHAMSGEVDIQIDGNPSKLIDLSTTGAQILSPGALKPNRLVTVLLPVGEGRLACKAKIMWSRLEPGRTGGMWYRAGVSFTSADQKAIEEFLKGKKAK